MPHVITFHRHRHTDRAVLFDENLDLLSLDEVRALASQKVDFIVIDSETGEDITRVLLA
jgi:polyhydroxyalkanoate synthesis regulator protein